VYVSVEKARVGTELLETFDRNRDPPNNWLFQ